jgi:hypothetical protein
MLAEGAGGDYLRSTLLCRPKSLNSLIGYSETIVRSVQSVDGKSLALIGNASAQEVCGQRRMLTGRGIFDKETRRKALAFAADAANAYGD